MQKPATCCGAFMIRTLKLNLSKFIYLRLVLMQNPVTSMNNRIIMLILTIDQCNLASNSTSNELLVPLVSEYWYIPTFYFLFFISLRNMELQEYLAFSKPLLFLFCRCSIVYLQCICLYVCMNAVNIQGVRERMTKCQTLLLRNERQSVFTI